MFQFADAIFMSAESVVCSRLRLQKVRVLKFSGGGQSCELCPVLATDVVCMVAVSISAWEFTLATQ